MASIEGRMELAQEACQRMKAECEFAAFEWDELIPGLLDKKFDVIMSSMHITSERRKRMGMSGRYYLSPGAFIAAKGAPFDGPPSLLRNQRIGIQRDPRHRQAGVPTMFRLWLNLDYIS